MVRLGQSALSFERMIQKGLSMNAEFGNDRIRSDLKFSVGLRDRINRFVLWEYRIFAEEKCEALAKVWIEDWEK